MAEEDAVCDVIILPIVPPMISQRPDGRILEDQRRFQTARLLLVVRIEHGPPNRRARRQTIAGFVVNPDHTEPALIRNQATLGRAMSGLLQTKNSPRPGATRSFSFSITTSPRDNTVNGQPSISSPS